MVVYSKDVRPDTAADEFSSSEKPEEERRRDGEQLQTLKDDFELLHQRTDRLFENVKCLKEQSNNFQHLLEKFKASLDDIELKRKRAKIVRQNLKLSQEQYSTFDKRSDKSKEDQHPHERVEVNLPINSSDLKKAMAIGKYKYVDKSIKYVTNTIVFQGREPETTQMKWSPVDSEDPSAYIPSGATASGEIPFPVSLPSLATDVSVLTKTVGQTTTEIQRNYPKTHIEPFNFTSTFTKVFELGMMRDLTVISNTKANIELIIIIACSQHKTLPDVSKELDRVRCFIPGSNL